MDPARRMYQYADAYREALSHPLAQEGFRADHAAMEWADTFVMVQPWFVMVQPCGRSAHLELGWACGQGKSCWVLLEDGQEPELLLLEVGDTDRLCLDLGELIDALEREGCVA